MLENTTLEQVIGLAISLCLIGAIVYPTLWPSAPLRRPLPPGPPGNWLKPGPYAPRKFAELVDAYGPVITLRAGSGNICIIGRHQAAVDILQKQSHDVADRPPSLAAGDILSGGKRMLLMREGERMRKMRRALISQLQPNVSIGYASIQMRNAKNYILDILDRPDDHLTHAKRYAASVIISMTYGKATPTSYSDPEVQEVIKCLTRLGKTLLIGANLVDSYPILQYIPGFTSKLRRYHREELTLFRQQMDMVRQRLSENKAQPCFATYLLEHQESYGLSDDEAAYLAGSMFGAGSDTTAAALGFVTMAAATHPEEQARVQAELDAIVGRDRIPNFEDQSQLNRVTAFVLESYRWRPVSFGGFAHRATKDIIWNEYVIPEGTTLFGVHWAIAHDPEVYPDPEVFRPDRWLDKSGNIREDLKFYNFGFGRRVCPGQHVAHRSVYINTALVLWAFNISEDPSSRINTMAFTDSANIHPLPFKVKFEARMENVKSVIQSHMD